MVAMQYLAFQDLHRQRVLNQPLDRPLQGTRAIRTVVALDEQQLLRLRRELDGDLALSQKLAQIVQPQLDDMRQLLLAQRLEHNDVVNSVQELRTEVLP